MKNISFNELCEKEVININNCKRLGYISDICIDIECGRIISVTVRECTGFPPKSNEYNVLWEQISKIGDDIIFVDICLTEVRQQSFSEKSNRKKFFG